MCMHQEWSKSWEKRKKKLFFSIRNFFPSKLYVPIIKMLKKKNTSINFDISQQGLSSLRSFLGNMKGWQRDWERKDTDRRKRSGRYSIEKRKGGVKKTLSVWPGGILNNGWMKWRVERRGGSRHHRILPFCLFSSTLTFFTPFSHCFFFFSSLFFHWHYMGQMLTHAGIIYMHTFIKMI